MVSKPYSQRHIFILAMHMVLGCRVTNVDDNPVATPFDTRPLNMLQSNTLQAALPKYRGKRLTAEKKKKHA